MNIIFAHNVTEKILNEIYDIVKDFTKDFFTDNFPDDIIIDMKFQRTAYLTINDEVISVIVFTSFDGIPQIKLMATKREYMGNGYGKILMKSFIEYLSNMELRKIELYTFIPEKKPINLSTVSFYESVGFIREKEYPYLWEDGALKMIKEW